MLNCLRPQPLLSVHRRPRPQSVIYANPRAKLISNLRRFIHHGMVDRTNQIWSDRNLHCVILRGMVTYVLIVTSDFHDIGHEKIHVVQHYSRHSCRLSRQCCYICNNAHAH